MAAAAFWLSIASILVAGAAAWYTRHYALTEQARLHNERQPQFRASYDVRRDPRGDHEGESHVVVAFVYMSGPATLERVTVTLVHRSEATHPPVMSIGSGLDAPTTTTAELTTPFALGQERIVRVDRHPDAAGGVAPFQLHCVIGDEAWDFVVECEVPPVPKILFSY
jgi:hypothetical protein